MARVFRCLVVMPLRGNCFHIAILLLFNVVFVYFRAARKELAPYDPDWFYVRAGA